MIEELKKRNLPVPQSRLVSIAGDEESATAPDFGLAIAGLSGTARSGHSGTSVGSVSVTGKNGIAIGGEATGDLRSIVVGFHAHSGEAGIAISYQDEFGIATAGDRGIAISDIGDSSVGEKGIAISSFNGKVRGGKGSLLIFHGPKYGDAVFTVGKDGILPNVFYTYDSEKERLIPDVSSFKL